MDFNFFLSFKIGGIVIIPDKFKFFGPKTKQNVQVGNAVPPILGKVMARRIKKYLDESV